MKENVSGFLLLAPPTSAQSKIADLTKLQGSKITKYCSESMENSASHDEKMNPAEITC